MTNPQRNCRTCHQPIPPDRMQRSSGQATYCRDICNPKRRPPVQGPKVTRCLICIEPLENHTIHGKFCSTGCRLRNHDNQPKRCPGCGDEKPGYTSAGDHCKRCRSGIGPTLDYLPIHGPTRRPWTQVVGPLVPFCLHCGTELAHTGRQLRKRYCSDRCSHQRNGHYMATARAKRRAATTRGTLTPKDWRRILAEHGHRCHWCNSPGNMTMDHVMPISLDGQHEPDNVVPACDRCNQLKGALHPEDWAAKMKSLGIVRSPEPDQRPIADTQTRHAVVDGAQLEPL